MLLTMYALVPTVHFIVLSCKIVVLLVVTYLDYEVI